MISREMPTYVDTKLAHALQIKSVEHSKWRTISTLHFYDEGYSSIEVDESWCMKHNVHADGWLVVESGGRQVFMSDESFKLRYKPATPKMPRPKTMIREEFQLVLKFNSCSETSRAKQFIESLEN